MIVPCTCVEGHVRCLDDDNTGYLARCLLCDGTGHRDTDEFLLGPLWTCYLCAENYILEEEAHACIKAHFAADDPVPAPRSKKHIEYPSGSA